jgi:signal transduction histidine kinase
VAGTRRSLDGLVYGARPRFPWVMPSGGDIHGWLSALAVTTIAGVAAGVLAAGLPPGAAGIGTLAQLFAAGALSALALSPRIRDLRLVVPSLIGVGLCGAGLDWQSDGPGFIASYMSLMGLALRTPWRIAIMSAIPVVTVISVEETYQSANPASTILTVLFASGLLFITAAFAAVSLDERHRAEDLLAQEAATSEARQRAAALAERSRLARDLHDVLAHNLCALAVQLEATRLTAIDSGAEARLVDQVASARELACIGMLEARRALQLLREGDTPDAESLPRLISETSVMLGIPVTLESDGVPCPLSDGAGLALYRVVQEALTNVAKHAGRGAEATVTLGWAADGVQVSITDAKGDGVAAALPSGGYGLSGMADRVRLNGGWLRAGPTGAGFTVRLWLPAGPAVVDVTR